MWPGDERRHGNYCKQHRMPPTPAHKRRTNRLAIQPEVVVPVTPQRGITARTQPPPAPIRNRHRVAVGASNQRRIPAPAEITPPPTHPRPNQQRRVIHLVSENDDDVVEQVPLANRARYQNQFNDDYEREDDDAYQDIPGSPNDESDYGEALPVPKRRRRAGRTTWTEEEFQALANGLRQYARSPIKWVQILKDPRFGADLRDRTPVDLKDKARNEKKARLRTGKPLGAFVNVSHHGGDGARHYYIE